MRLRNLPTRLAVGAYVLHTGLEKWNGGSERAAGLHKMASDAYPPLARIDPPLFLRLLSIGEMSVGAGLLTPLVPRAVAGAALTGFSGALVGMYLRTPGMHKPGSVWPEQKGIGVSKDVWMLAMGLGLIVDGLLDRKRG
jgi:uncharacterized membrane protein YphA (DoxX/SURF4 family)